MDILTLTAAAGRQAGIIGAASAASGLADGMAAAEAI